MRSLGIDLGGTGIKACVLVDRAHPDDAAGFTAETHAKDGPKLVLDRIAALAEKAIGAAGEVDHVGLAAPGPLDVERGLSLFMPNLPGWTETPIVAELESRLGRPVALLNDARALTLAELELGAGRGCRNVVCFALGTGVGGGVVVDGRLLLGMNGTIGELGHQTVDPDGPPCACGSRGCLEQYASGSAIARGAGTPTPAGAFEAARAGDARAVRAVERAATMLGIGIANVVLAVGPERVVVGGGAAAAGELLLEPARQEFARRNRMMPIERMSILPAELGPFAGAIGAALWGERAAVSRRV
jgi:glucokinase